MRPQNGAREKATMAFSLVFRITKIPSLQTSRPYFIVGITTILAHFLK